MQFMSRDVDCFCKHCNPIREFLFLRLQTASFAFISHSKMPITKPILTSGIMSTINTPEPIKSSSNLLSTPDPQHEPRTPFTIPERTGCRSVKSIVAWLESSSNNQPCSPRSTVLDMAHDFSTGSVSTYHDPRRHNYSVSAASDIEDYSLTYLKYKNYFTSAPLGRCLDNENKSPTEHRTNSLTVTQSSTTPVSTKVEGHSKHTRVASQDSGCRMKESVVPPIRRDPAEVRAF